MSENMGATSSPEEKAAADAAVEQSRAELEFTPASTEPATDYEDPYHKMTDQELMAMQEKKAKAATPVIKHVWTGEDTYASLALKFYGSFKEPYWRLIYEHNKAIIGNHPNAIREGLEIEIPPLPDELKLK
jgi:nucleoid-associated protein YgaU